jgi:hypothetical protein
MDCDSKNVCLRSIPDYQTILAHSRLRCLGFVSTCLPEIIRSPLPGKSMDSRLHGFFAGVDKHSNIHLLVIQAVHKIPES